MTCPQIHLVQRENLLCKISVTIVIVTCYSLLIVGVNSRIVFFVG